MKRIKKLPNPGVVIGVIALVAALGGTAIALPGSNKVGKNDIKKGSVNARNIAKDAVGISEIAQDGVGLPEITAGAEAALSPRWALVNETGQIEQQTGGFSLVNCYQANANCYIKFAGDDLRDDGLRAQIAIGNVDGMASQILSGETGVAPCGATFVACAPPGTELNDVLVVAPRESDGTPPGAGTGAPAPADAARFYVFVTGS